MKNTTSDFDKLNHLLQAAFAAEKVYYNASEDAQETHLKRFLGYMATERNRMAFDISNELSSRHITPSVPFSEKGHTDRNWKEIKEALVNYNPEELILNCIGWDKTLVVKTKELLDNQKLPKEVLDMLENNHKKIQWYIKQARQHLVSHFKVESDKAKDSSHDSKVISIKKAQ
ncbi:uncharacterized protein DUF2383 [Ulvibacter sp. MAR_2010_11]|uniref:DUF2383 domain-containing protein n=1 Tax=Ulvibacter sp. MAR_2010_11 TaxID=1250229 RepID=UPI000C2C2367|nr:DUF2383 domain-containing protein [Ulvibacter sp. MAR_2010_11]PKA82165.1 uncharacterized protein DUF2383 [Ulvibacter sp. MAR_2010_11]